MHFFDLLGTAIPCEYSLRRPWVVLVQRMHFRIDIAFSKLAGFQIEMSRSEAPRIPVKREDHFLMRFQVFMYQVPQKLRNFFVSHVRFREKLRLTKTPEVISEKTAQTRAFPRVFDIKAEIFLLSP